MGLISTLRKAKRKLYLAHHNADWDALSSVYLLARAVPGDVAVAGNIRPDTDGYRAKLGLQLVLPDPESLAHHYDLVVVVDSFSWAMVAGCPPRGVPFVLVDHHEAQWHQQAGALAPEAAALYHAEASSCSWYIYRLLRAARVPITREMALAALCGYVGDQGFYSHRYREMAKVADMMAQYGLTVEDAQAAMEPLTLPDPVSALAVLQTGKVIHENGCRIFVGEVDDVGRSYQVRAKLAAFGFHAVLLKLEQPGHRAVLFSVPRTPGPVAERWIDRIRERYPDAVHWGSGLTPTEPLDDVVNDCVDLLRAELRAVPG